MDGSTAYALAKGYTDETVIGGGALKGKNCTISSIAAIEGGNRITFNWTLDDGTVKSQTLDVKDGADGYTPEKDVDYFDGEKGDKGDKGNGITAITKTGTSGIVDIYTIVFDDGTTTTYNVVNGSNITKLSELENDEEFIKATTINLTNYFLKTETYSKAQIDEILRNVGAGLSVKIVATLPLTDISPTTIYLINTSGSNYNQYMYIDGSWANLGSTAVDMSSYYNKTQIDTKLEDYVTANRLTNKLDDYVLKTGLSKVGKSNSYNDLDDLPEIPDVSGVKPYVDVLQNSSETAPTSKVVYDAVQDLEEKIEKAGAIDDDAIAEDSTWSSKKINDSLVDIEQEAGNVYSTEETVCGKWIDGKPLYRKVFYSETSSFTTATHYSAPYAKKLIEYSNMYRNNYVDFVPAEAKLYNQGLADAYFQIPSPSYGEATCWIVKYTKSTD